MREAAVAHDDSLQVGQIGMSLTERAGGGCGDTSQHQPGQRASPSTDSSWSNVQGLPWQGAHTTRLCLGLRMT